MDIGNLKASGRKVRRSLVPLGRHQLREDGSDGMNRVVGEVWVGDVALYPMDREDAVQRASTTHFYGVTNGAHRGGFADNAIVDFFALAVEPINDLDGAVGCDAFFVGSDKQAYRPVVLRMSFNEFLDCNNKRRQRGLHIGSAASIDVAISYFRDKRIAIPHIAGPSWHHIRMTSKDYQRCILSPLGPEVIDLTKSQTLYFKAKRTKTLYHEVLAPFVIRRHRWTCHQRHC